MPPISTDPQIWLTQVPVFLQQGVMLTLQHSNRDLAVFLRTYLGTLQLMFNTVPERYRTQAAALSSLGVAINVLLDDIADRDGRSDLIEIARQYMVGGVRKAVCPDLTALVIMWDSYLEQISQAPLYAKLEDRLLYEWNKLLNAMAYSIVVNTDVTHVHNLADSIRMASPNMHHVIKHVVDICFSPDWNPDQTDAALEFAERAQIVSRIGNWYKSWQQELRQHRDITSGVFALACDWGLFTKTQLLDPTLDPEVIIKTIETHKHEVEDDKFLTAPEFLLEYAYKSIVQIQNWTVSLPFTDLTHYGQMLYLTIEQQKQGTNESR